MAGRFNEDRISNNDKEECEVDVSATSCAIGQGSRNSLSTQSIALPTVSVLVRGQGQQEYVKVKALLDSGSDRSFCSTELMTTLGLQGKSVSLSLETLNGDKTSNVKQVPLEVKSLNRKSQIMQINSCYAIQTMTR